MEEDEKEKNLMNAICPKCDVIERTATHQVNALGRPN